MELPISLSDFSVKERGLVFLFLTLLAWNVFDYFFYRPVSSRLSTISIELMTKKNQVEQRRLWFKKISPTREKIRMALVDLRRPYASDPSVQVAEFNRIIREALDRHGIQIKSMNPGNISDVPGKQYKLLTYELDLRSSYNELGLFISDLENAELLFEIAGLKISPVEGQPMVNKVILKLNAYIVSFS